MREAVERGEIEPADLLAAAESLRDPLPALRAIALLRLWLEDQWLQAVMAAREKECPWRDIGSACP